MPSTPFANTAKNFRVIHLDRGKLDKARADYTFLKDRLNGCRVPSISA